MNHESQFQLSITLFINKKMDIYKVCYYLCTVQNNVNIFFFSSR